MNRRARHLPRNARFAEQIRNSTTLNRAKTALRARDENSAEKISKYDLFQDAENSKKSRKALSDGRYNLKHFVTAMGRQFAHNGLNGFNTDAVSCAKCERTRSAASPVGHVLKPFPGASLLESFPAPRRIRFQLWSPRANPVACGF
ncbi:hypothetical protein BVIET440_220023 [Burkholderia vietnamiensis]